eukprot:g140.t1
MNSENDPVTSRPPYHPGVQATNWIPPCWTVAPGQVPVWPTITANQFGQVLSQPICFMSQLPTTISQQSFLPTQSAPTVANMPTPYHFTSPDPAPVKQESVYGGYQKDPGRGRRGQRGGFRRRGSARFIKNRTQVRQDIPVRVRAPQSAAEAEEVRQWISQRKQNFPRQENAKVQESIGSNADRAKELKEILSRQQELGVTGIAGTEGMLHRLGGNRPNCSRAGPNGMNKRKRFNGGDNQGKRILQNGSFNRRHVVKKPMSLLEKLLYKETRQNKSHALQCIRFFVENNFLQDLGKKPLVFPCESEGEEEEKVQECLESGRNENASQDHSGSEERVSSEESGSENADEH